MNIAATVKSRIVDEIIRRLSDDNDVGLVIKPGEMSEETISTHTAAGEFVVLLEVGDDEAEDGATNLSNGKIVAGFDVGVVIVFPSPLPDDGTGHPRLPHVVAAAAHAWVQTLYATAELQQWTSPAPGSLAQAQRTDVIGGGGVFEDDALKLVCTESAFRVTYGYSRGDAASPR